MTVCVYHDAGAATAGSRESWPHVSRSCLSACIPSDVDSPASAVCDNHAASADIAVCIHMQRRHWLPRGLFLLRHLRQIQWHPKTPRLLSTSGGHLLVPLHVVGAASFGAWLQLGAHDVVFNFYHSRTVLLLVRTCSDPQATDQATDTARRQR